MPADLTLLSSTTTTLCHISVCDPKSNAIRNWSKNSKFNNIYKIDFFLSDVSSQVRLLTDESENILTVVSRVIVFVPHQSELWYTGPEMVQISRAQRQ